MFVIWNGFTHDLHVQFVVDAFGWHSSVLIRPTLFAKFYIFEYVEKVATIADMKNEQKPNGCNKNRLMRDAKILKCIMHAYRFQH